MVCNGLVLLAVTAHGEEFDYAKGKSGTINLDIRDSVPDFDACDVAAAMARD